MNCKSIMYEIDWFSMYNRIQWEIVNKFDDASRKHDMTMLEYRNLWNDGETDGS